MRSYGRICSDVRHAFMCITALPTVRRNLGRKEIIKGNVNDTTTRNVSTRFISLNSKGSD